MKEAQNAHALFFLYVEKILRTPYVHGREGGARNFQTLLKVKSQLCHMQFFQFLISTRFANTSVAAMTQKPLFFFTPISVATHFLIAAVRTAGEWPSGLFSCFVQSIFFFQHPF